MRYLVIDGKLEPFIESTEPIPEDLIVDLNGELVAKAICKKED